MVQMDLRFIKSTKITQLLGINMSKADWFFIGCYTGWVASYVWRLGKLIYTNAKKATDEQSKA
jgi:hypothetical protein